MTLMLLRLTLLSALAVAVPQQQPPRDIATPAPTVIGTASVSGRVTVGDDAGTPVPRAVVTLTSPDGRDARSAITGADGRFDIGGLPAGRYALVAKKPAHLASAFGARRPGRPGTTLVVEDGQRLEGLDWALPRGGVLAGRVTMANGEPVPNTAVLVIAERYATSGGMLSAGEVPVRTDDRGEFRVYGLLPDRYLLAAVPEFGRGEIAIRQEGDIDTLFQTLRGPVTGLPAGAIAGAHTAPPTARTTGFAPVYFPGTPMVHDATRIAIAPGDILEGLDFIVTQVPVATLRGTIVDTTGAPLQAVSIAVQPTGPALPISSALAARASRPNARGEFTVTGLTPGHYTIRARAGGVTLGAQETISISGAAQTDWAQAEVTVTGEDIDGVFLAMQPGLTFSGRITTVGPGDPPATWKGVSVSIQPVRTGPSTILNNEVAPRSASVADDGTLMVTGVAPGHYEVRVFLPPSIASDWSVASVLHGDRELRDAPLTFSQGSIDDVTIVLSTQRTALSGTLQSSSGAPATDYYVVVFPSDRGVWHPASPRVQVARPAADGLFRLEGLPPGAYRIAALTDVEEDEPRSAAFLESIYEASIPVTIAPGQQVRQDIRINR